MKKGRMEGENKLNQEKMEKELNICIAAHPMQDRNGKREVGKCRMERENMMNEAGKKKERKGMFKYFNYKRSMEYLSAGRQVGETKPRKPAKERWRRHVGSYDVYLNHSSASPKQERKRLSDEEQNGKQKQSARAGK